MKTKKRRCKHKGCDTILSSYNKGDRCFAHTPGIIIESYYGSKATSYKKTPVDPLKKDHNPERLLAGGTGQAEQPIFEKESTEYVNEDGKSENIENLIGG